MDKGSVSRFCAPSVVSGVTCACTMRSRLRGLLGRDGFEGILMLAPCGGIHTFGMRFPIDVAFVSSDGRVLSAHRNVSSRRRLRCRRAVITLERAADSAAPWYRKGDRIRIDIGADDGKCC